MSTVTKCRCGHEISQHTYSDTDCGCDIEGCNCMLDLGELIDKYAMEIADGIKQTKQIEANYDALQSPMPCGHLARYAVNGEDGTQYCCMCLATETQKENGVLRRYIANLENELDEQ